MSNPTSSQADIDLIIRELGAHRSQADVCRILCAERGYDWLAAQRLVDQVAAQRRTSIARRQAPLLILIGVITLIGGVALLGLSAYGLMHAGPARGARSARRLITGVALGALMVVGSAIGLVQVVRAMWQ